jgi:hypothetical protein
MIPFPSTCASRAASAHTARAVARDPCNGWSLSGARAPQETHPPVQKHWLRLAAGAPAGTRPHSRLQIGGELCIVQHKLPVICMPRGPRGAGATIGSPVGAHRATPASSRREHNQALQAWLQMPLSYIFSRPPCMHSSWQPGAYPGPGGDGHCRQLPGKSKFGSNMGVRHVERFKPWAR